LKQMFLDLKELGYEGSYDRVAAFGRQWKVGQMARVNSASKSTLLNAISTGRVPVRPKTKTPLLTAELPDLDFWVGKPIGFDRPWFKRHLSDLQSEVRPVSSWVRGAVEEEILDEFTVGLAAQRSGTGEHSVNEILGFNAFPYPKPISLIKGLLAQATKPSDVVLDFFAGSGTTGQAILELNAEDGGERRFILCSSTEANDKEPSKNLCRDVCAARIRRVIQGYGTKDGHSVAGGGEFAYLQLDKLDAADVALDATAEHAATLLTLRHAATVAVAHQSGPIHLIAKSADWLMALCSVVNGQVLDQLCGLPNEYQVARLIVYAPRPKALAELLAERGVEAQVHTLRQALIQGQGGR
ncbi:DNA methyltransferase, partial [Herbaspirillum sp. AP02]|uniref:DNA methyltransferase n=2 Tax=unclassified Herbaspirillum TaxID=2624150 RepID=UPI0018C94B33